MKNLPKRIAEYFDFKNNHNKEGLLSVFSEHAVVIDRGENKEMRGQDQIESWIDTSLSGLSLQTDIAGCTEDNGVWIIDTIVRGDFKASPAKFVYRIVLEEDMIASLDIQFGGSVNT